MSRSKPTDGRQPAKPDKSPPETEICGRETCGQCGTENRLGRTHCCQCGITFVYCANCKKRISKLDGMKRAKLCSVCVEAGHGEEHPEVDHTLLGEFTDEAENARRFAFHEWESTRQDQDSREQEQHEKQR